MNKIIAVLALVFLALPFFAFAQDTCTLKVDMPDINPYCMMTNNPISVENYGMCCLVNSIYVLTDWLSFIIAGIVGLLIIYGAILIITAGGTPEKVTAGRNYIMYAVIGFIVFLFARAIPSIAKAILGM